MSFDKLYQDCVVCARHFLPEQLQFGCRRGLKPNAIPVLFLNEDQENIRTAVSSEPNEALPSTSRVQDVLSPLSQSSKEITCSLLPVKIGEDSCIIKCADPTESINNSFLEQYDAIPSSSFSCDVEIGQQNFQSKIFEDQNDVPSTSFSESSSEFNNSMKLVNPRTPPKHLKISDSARKDQQNVQSRTFEDPNDVPSTSFSEFSAEFSNSMKVISPSTPPKHLKLSNSARKGSRKTGILKEINVTRQKLLSPKAKHLYKKVIEKSNSIAKLSLRLKSFKSRIQAAEKMANSSNFVSLMDHVNSITYKFIMSQVRTQFQKPKARRYTIDEKILALTILKASGKGYKLLAKIFCLPTKKTLINLLKKIPFSCGINKDLFENLRKPVSQMKKHDRMAILVFDEMSINTLLHYNSKDDMVEGIQDLGNGDRKAEIADYANVFMLKGVFRQWKQPICYTFSSGPTKSNKLKKLIIEIIKECSSIGLEVIATICNQGGPNQATVNSLLQDTKEWCSRNNVDECFGFMVDGQEVIPLYDTPHLFKGIRNNLLTKDLHFNINNRQGVAKWLHLEQFYMLDVEDPERIYPKLTDEHILRDKINKMKVKCCTQVFSHQVGAIMRKILTWKSQVNLDPKAMDTSTLILFLDKLFDSLNSSHKSGPPGKPLKGGVTLESGHITFWYECIKVFESMKFYCHKKQKFVTVPTLKNIVRTLRGFIYLCQKILKMYPKKFILLRVFQQDALENFFGCIRNYSGRENNPSAAHFLTSFKSLLVNNFMSAHSPGANCEEDQGEGALDNMHDLILGRRLVGVSPLEPNINLQIPLPVISYRKSKISRCTITYISGFISRKLFKKIKCDECKKTISFRDHNQDVDFIDARRYSHSKLIKPGTYLSFLVCQSIRRLFYLIPRVCHFMNISDHLQKNLLKELNFKLINSPCHSENDKILSRIIIRCCLFFWCKQVNAVAKGNDVKFNKFLKMNPHTSLVDPIKLQAYKKCENKRKRLKKLKK